VDSLEKTVNSLLPQVNFLFVALNGHKEVPKFLCNKPRISYALLDNKMADCAKFHSIDERVGYIFTCDDDIIYPHTYCQDMIDGINKYKCIVSLHGKQYPRPIKSFYNIEKNYRCLGNVPKGGYVDVGGSGVMAWHTDFFKLRHDDCKTPNMADICVSRIAKEQGVKIMVLPHTENYLQHIRYKDNLFVREHKKGFSEQTRMLKEIFNA